MQYPLPPSLNVKQLTRWFFKLYVLTFILPVFILLCSNVSAQAISQQQSFEASHINFDSLINLHGRKERSPVLFIHFDKNVYSNNENVWFAGYLLNYANTTLYKTLSLTLVKDDDRSIVMDDRFVINGGFCYGNTSIPDSVRAGAYTFVAYANRLNSGKPDVLFTQQITIKTETAQTFNATLSPLDTSATAASQKVMLLVTFMEAKTAPAAIPVTYFIGDSRKPVTTGAVKTALGQYIFNIPSNVLNASNNTLHVQVKHNDEVHDVKMKLPVPLQPQIVNFFPEGGNLVDGIANLVGWEIKSAEGAPVSAFAQLFENDKLIDSIQTNGNGTGKFYLIPQTGKRYGVKLMTDKTKKVYNLPDVIKGATLTIRHAVVNDTLAVDVYNSDTHKKLYLLGHNYSRLFFETPVVKHPLQRVKIILNNIPRGLMQLTLVDSIGNAYAGRLFFAHYNNKSQLKISADKESYNSREKVKLNVKLEGESADAAVSVAVVQANRVEIKNKSDIESYIYLKRELKGIPVKESYFDNNAFSIRDLEDILLIKGWSRYTWTDVLKVQPRDTIQNLTEPVFAGKASKLFGKIKAPLTVITINPTVTYETDLGGSFSLPDSNLVTLPGKKVGIMVAGGSPSDYSIKITNPYDSINKHMAALIEPVIYHSPAFESSNMQQLPGNERAIRLKEVVIKDKRDDLFYGTGANACGDYVCMYNVLNCPNHRGLSENTQPVKGNAYRSGITGYNTVIYQGCNQTDNVKFKGIYAAQEFYPSDYAEISPSQPEYISTIYWKNQLLLKKGEAQEVSFYTSDITGQFKIIVQGITDDDVIYGEAAFNVKK